MTYKGLISIGDWSEDGHSRCEFFTFESSHDIDDLQKAYMSSREKSTISFDHDYNCEFKDPNAVCVEYKDNYITDYQLMMLHTTFRLDYSNIPETVENFSLQGFCVSPKDLAHVILWFSGKSLDDFEFSSLTKISKKQVDILMDDSQYTIFNGWWCDKLNVQFGYGLFGHSYYTMPGIRSKVNPLPENRKIFFNAHLYHYGHLEYVRLNSYFLSSSISYNDKPKKDFVEWCNDNFQGNVFKKGKNYFYENENDILLMKKYCKTKEYLIEYFQYKFKFDDIHQEEIKQWCADTFGEALYPNSTYPQSMLTYNEDGLYDFYKNTVFFKNKKDATLFKMNWK
jgi:hypothetical protein